MPEVFNAAAGLNRLKVKITAENKQPILGIEDFKPTFSSTKQEWKPFDLEGWEDNLITGKKCEMTVSGKRTYGAPGNDYIASIEDKMGLDAIVNFEWEKPDGTLFNFKGSVDVTNGGGGATEDVEKLEFTISVIGKPEKVASSGRVASSTPTSTPTTK